jgi:hypothetical protein
MTDSPHADVQPAPSAPDIEVTVVEVTHVEHEAVIVTAHHDAAPVGDDAHVAAEHVAAAESLQHEQAQSAEHGDYALAHERAEEASYELHVAAEHGAHVDDHLIDAQHDVAALDEASWHASIAHDDAVAATSYDQVEHADAATVYADHGADHASMAAEHGHAGDAGGSYASHDLSHDATT